MYLVCSIRSQFISITHTHTPTHEKNLEKSLTWFSNIRFSSFLLIFAPLGTNGGLSEEACRKWRNFQNKIYYIQKFANLSKAASTGGAVRATVTCLEDKITARNKFLVCKFVWNQLIVHSWLFNFWIFSYKCNPYL